MIVIFEDDGMDHLSLLFKTTYPEMVSKEFVYLKGIPGAVTKISKILESTEDIVVLYMDAVPDNIHLRKIYGNLRLLSIRNNYRLVIIPIVCAEYLFIKSVSSRNLISNEEVLKCCIEKKPYYKYLNLFSRPEDIRTFEKFCKHILIDFADDCISKSTIKGDGDCNLKYGNYYLKDCLCEKENTDCYGISLLEKSRNYISEYPCIPSGSGIVDSRRVDIDALWEIHRKCIESLNNMIQEFRDNGENIDNLCKKFYPIK